jgi:predicted transcriptional regulator
LDQSVLSELDALAQEMNQSPEELVTALIQGLARHKRQESSLAAECDRRLAEFEATRLGIPFDEIAQWMQSWFTDQEKPAPQCRVLYRK